MFTSTAAPPVKASFTADRLFHGRSVVTSKHACRPSVFQPRYSRASSVSPMRISRGFVFFHLSRFASTFALSIRPMRATSGRLASRSNRSRAAAANPAGISTVPL